MTNFLTECEAKTSSDMSFINAGILYNTTIGIRRYKEIPVVISGHLNGDLGIWNGKTSQFLQFLKSHKSEISGIEMISNENYTQIISISYDQTVKFWDSEDNGFNMSHTVKFDYPILCFTLSPNEKLMAFGGENRQLFVFK